MTPGWVPPTVAISLVIIALSFLVIGAVVLFIGLAIKKETSKAKKQLAVVAADAKNVLQRLKSEAEGFADLSADARGRLRGAIDTVDGRLKDLDALVEVLQEEVEETAMDVAAMMRTVRRTGGILGAARRAVMRRKR